MDAKCLFWALVCFIVLLVDLVLCPPLHTKYTLHCGGSMNITDISVTHPPEKLKHLTVIPQDDIEFIKQECIDFIFGAHNLTILNIYGFNGLQAHFSVILKNKPMLRKARFEQTDIKVLNVSVFNATPSLEELNLDNNLNLQKIIGFTSAPIREISLQNTPNLTTFDPIANSTLTSINLNNSGIQCQDLNPDLFPKLERCNGKLFERYTTSTSSPTTQQTSRTSVEAPDDNRHTAFSFNYGKFAAIIITLCFVVAVLVAAIYVYNKYWKLNKRERNESPDTEGLNPK